MNKFKTFYLDFVLVYGTMTLFIALHVIFLKASYDGNGLSIILGISLTYAIVKMFWDNYSSEKIEALENEIKQLKEEAAKKAAESN